jgi:hypothetical protein
MFARTFVVVIVMLISAVAARSADAPAPQVPLRRSPRPQMPEPLPPAQEDAIDILALPEGCTADQSGDIIDPSAVMQHMGSGAGKNPPNYMKLSQRGNIRQLTAADAALFDVPAGYKQDQQLLAHPDIVLEEHARMRQTKKLRRHDRISRLLKLRNADEL